MQLCCSNVLLWHHARHANLEEMQHLASNSTDTKADTDQAMLELLMLIIDCSNAMCIFDLLHYMNSYFSKTIITTCIKVSFSAVLMSNCDHKL